MRQLFPPIQERGYVHTENRRFYAEKMGEIVTDRLNESFGELMNYDFTANMEDTLDKIASGSVNWKTELNQFFKDFSSQLSKAELDELEGGMRPNSLRKQILNAQLVVEKWQFARQVQGCF